MEADIDEICAAQHIDPHLRRVLLTLVDPNWGKYYDIVLPQDYQDLFYFQANLHDNSVFLGCFSTEWVRLQQKFLVLNDFPRDKQQAKTGIKKLMLYVLNLSHTTMWLQRNKALHGDDATSDNTTSIVQTYPAASRDSRPLRPGASHARQ